jgi:hypothetical protein
MFITSIAAIVLTHAAQAKTWAWFHGDIGVNSPFFSSSNSAANTVSTSQTTKSKAIFERAVTKKQVQVNQPPHRGALIQRHHKIQNEQVTKL